MEEKGKMTNVKRNEAVVRNGNCDYGHGRESEARQSEPMALLWR